MCKIDAVQLSSLCQASLKPSQDKEGKKDIGSLVGCTAEDKNTLKASQEKLSAYVNQSLDRHPMHGAWITPCLAHVLPVYVTEKQRKVQRLCEMMHAFASPLLLRCECCTCRRMAKHSTRHLLHGILRLDTVMVLENCLQTMVPMWLHQ